MSRVTVRKWLWVTGDPKPGSRFLPNQWPDFPWPLRNILWTRVLRSCAYLPANLQITCQPWTIIDIVIPFKYENCHNKSKHSFLNIYSNLYIDQYGQYFNLIWWNSIILKLNSATILPKPGGSCPWYWVHTCASVVKTELSVIPALNSSGLVTVRWIWLRVQLPATQSSETPRWGARTHCLRLWYCLNWEQPGGGGCVSINHIQTYDPGGQGGHKPFQNIKAELSDLQRCESVSWECQHTLAVPARGSQEIGGRLWI